MASTTHSRSRLCLIALTLTGLFCTANSGCSFFAANFQNETIAEPAAQHPTYKVRVYNGKKYNEQVVQLDSNMTLQGVVEESGVINKFAKMEVVLVRKIPGKERAHRMPADFDPKLRQIALAQDYAVQSGDVIMIRKDSSNAFDATMKKFGGGLGFGN